MEYFAKAWHGVSYEAYVTVVPDGDVLEPEFCTMLAFINDEVATIDEVPEAVQLMLLDDACDQWAWEFDES